MNEIISEKLKNRSIQNDPKRPVLPSLVKKIDGRGGFFGKKLLKLQKTGAFAA